MKTETELESSLKARRSQSLSVVALRAIHRYTLHLLGTLVKAPYRTSFVIYVALSQGIAGQARDAVALGKDRLGCRADVAAEVLQNG